MPRIPEFTSSAHFWLQQQEEPWAFPLKPAAASILLLERLPIDSTSRLSLGPAAEDHTAEEGRFIKVQPPSLAQRELYTHNSPPNSCHLPIGEISVTILKIHWQNNQNQMKESMNHILFSPVKTPTEINGLGSTAVRDLPCT